MIENYVIERFQNGFIATEDDCSSVCSERSSLSDHSVSVMFPSSHPCIESRDFGTDNGAVVLVPILGKHHYFNIPVLTLSMLWAS